MVETNLTNYNEACGSLFCPRKSHTDSTNLSLRNSLSKLAHGQSSHLEHHTEEHVARLLLGTSVSRCMLTPVNGSHRLALCRAISGLANAARADVLRRSWWNGMSNRRSRNSEEFGGSVEFFSL
jgi:hypothetical protein